MSEKKSSEQSEAFDIHLMEAKVSSDPSNEGKKASSINEEMEARSGDCTRSSGSSSEDTLSSGRGLEQYKCQFDKLKYCIPVKDRFCAKSNVYCFPDVCEVIEKYLSEGDLEALRRSCFGWVFVQGSKMKLNFQLIHQMMLHMIESDKEHELWFKVDGLVARFSLVEFHAITGLPVIDNKVKSSGDFSWSYFLMTKQSKCTYDELMGAFINCRPSSSKKLEMAKLLIIVNMLMFRRSKSVKVEHAGIVCNPAKCELYPWGRESYSLLVKSLKKVLLCDRSDPRPSYELFGYIFAFQAWILEAFPVLSDKFDCNFKMRAKDAYSLHWECSIRHNYEDAKELFNGDLAPMFPNFGEFARRPGMDFEDEVPHPILDHIAEPSFSQLESHTLYDCRRLRKYAYGVKFSCLREGDVLSLTQDVASAETQTGKEHGGDEDADAAASKKKRKSEGKDKCLVKKQKILESKPTTVRRGRSAGLVPAQKSDVISKPSWEIGSVKKKKSKGKKISAVKKSVALSTEDAIAKPRFVFRRRGKSVSQDSSDLFMPIEIARPPSSHGVTEVGGKLPIEGVPAKDSGNDDANVEVDSVAEAVAEGADDFEDVGTGKDVLNAETNEELNMGGTEEVVGGVVKDDHSKERAEKDVLGGGTDDCSIKGEPPSWVKEILKRLDKLEELPKRVEDFAVRLDKLEEFMSANIKLGSVVAGLVEKIQSLENRFTMHESMLARTQSSNVIPSDPVSTKAVNDVLVDIGKEIAVNVSEKVGQQIYTNVSASADEGIPITLVEGQKSLDTCSAQLFSVDLGRDSDVDLKSGEQGLEETIGAEMGLQGGPQKDVGDTDAEMEVAAKADAETTDAETEVAAKTNAGMTDAEIGGGEQNVLK